MSTSHKETTQQSAMALGWVIDSLEETLQNAQDIVQTAKQAVQLAEAGELLHQVSGTLTMTELLDPLILSESLEQLAEAIAANSIDFSQQLVLLSGIQTLSRELKLLHQTKRLQPLNIYRTVKEIRSLLQAQKLSTSTAYPKLDYNLLVEPNQVQSVLDDDTWKKTTLIYRHLLNEFLLNPKQQDNLENLVKVARFFAAGANNLQNAALWQVLTRLHQAMYEGKVDLSSIALKHSLVRLERMLAQEQYDESMLFELLELFEQFNLEHEFALHQQAINAAMDDRSITSPLVLDKILALVQDARTKLSQPDKLDNMQVKRLLSEAVRLLELTGWRDISTGIKQLTQQFNSTERLQTAELLDHLNDIEQQLNHLVQAFETQSNSATQLNDQKIISDAHNAVVRESRVALESIKNQFFNYSSSKRDAELLKDLPERFNELKGIFVLLNLNRAASLVNQLVETLNQTLLQNQYTTSRGQIDLIAQVIASLEYYLDQLAAHFHDEKVLDKLEQVLQQVYFSQEDTSVEPVGGEKIFHDQTPLELLSSIEGEAMSKPSQEQSKPVVKPQVAKAYLDITLPEDDFSEDDDIREIFVEEATEVLESLQENFPKWSAQPQDFATLKEVRRSFHTLKGSGRMVGAKASGELAWSIENMLNRVLDNTVQVTPVMIELISTVLSIYPELVENFAAKQEIAIELRAYIAVANTLSKGQTVEADQLPWTQAETALAKTQAETVEDAYVDETQAATVEDAYVDETQAATNQVDMAATVPATVNEDMMADQEGLNIFVEEAEEHIDALHAFIADEDAHEEVPDHVIRALHTLRGSAAMSHVDSIYRLASALEEEFKRLIRMHLPVSATHIGFLERFVQCVGSHLEALESGQTLELEAHDVELIEQVNQVTQQAAQEESEAIAGGAPSNAGIVSQLLTLPLDELLDAEYELEEHLGSADIKDYLNTLTEQSQQLHAAALATSITPLQQLTQYLTNVYYKLKDVPPKAIEQNHVECLLSAHYALTEIFDALAATQKPTLDMQLIDELSDILAHDFNPACLAVVEEEVTEIAAEAEQVESTESVAESISVQEAETTEVEPIAIQSQDTESSSSALLAQSSVAVPSPTASLIDDQVDAELLEIFMEEAEELVNEIDQSFVVWQNNPSDIEPLKVLQRHLHTLKGGARMAQVSSLGDFGHELETVYERLVNGSLQSTPALIQFMRHAQDIVAEQVEQLQLQGTSFYAQTELHLLRTYLHTGDDSILVKGINTASATSAIATPDVSAATTQKQDASQSANNLAQLADQGEITKAPATATTQSVPAQAKPEQQASPQQIITNSQMGGARRSYASAQEWTEEDRPDADMLSLFIEEAQEQVEHSNQLLQQWLKDSKDKRALLELQRSLHTMKGGARMAGITSVANFAHELEFVYEDLATVQKTVPALVGSLLQLCHDWLSDAIAVLEHNQQPLEPVALIQTLQLFRKDADSLTSLPRFDEANQQFRQDYAGQTLFEQESITEVHGDGTEPPSMFGLFNSQNTEQASSNEMIRVSASLMEKMINLAGENAINRGRIEMGVNNIGFVLDEMGLTIARLAEQLRRMEGELESQILARHEQERGQYTDFDPLEMDQYSSLNQLSKSLAESASDLVDFKNTLTDKIRDTENLLLQQSRIQSELQDGLMNSRLVPFSRMLPRLQRVVRQTSGELNKPAELIINNAEGELDRTILDGMVAPLEHMLRNAVDHGLETPEQRQDAGKPAVGQIELNIERQGNEIILTLEDDGKGINIQAVRQKAVERGLISADSKLNDYDVMQFIFHAGLSTADKITQISGRGVGMDVVQSEIKLLGGTVHVDSVQGKGTRFTMRLPLTVAVADALMVRVADRQFAIPLSQIDRIVRVSPVALEQYYQSHDESFNLDGQNYRLRYLGEFIQGIKAPNLQSQSMSLPVLLVKGMGQSTAIQVDQLVGSRAEIVVKPVGQQLTSIDMISGATIVGDGSVTVILDAQALARRASATARNQAVSTQKVTTETAPRQESKKRTVMVVDDSVTVRKVTSRLLERQGYDVVTAKDGVDAIEKLEEVTPDIMLLDIEMPRMDGFEVATLVRHSERTNELPIIMITSRTGEKHRERAFLTGVNAYMGKPFQEAELLQNIEELLAAASN
ncbi:hybrid sensor histidine kinase/response regulator [Alkanindiges illinoisensis]|nr:Hpt domain-containing protein [Alkanindiges illinoisensis]